MANYHVSNDENGIYAGTINKAGNKWVNASVVTDEAVSAVAAYMKTWLDRDGHDRATVNCNFSDGTHGNLILELTDENYEWHENPENMEGY